MNTYERIKILAKEKKISIRQLEMKFGYSNGYLAKWATNTPNSDELMKIADFFDVSVDYLLVRTDSRLPGVDLSEQEQNLLMRFRRGSKNLSEGEKEIYERQAMSLFDYINQTMHDLDEKNKPK